MHVMCETEFSCKLQVYFVVKTRKFCMLHEKMFPVATIKKPMISSASKISPDFQIRKFPQIFKYQCSCVAEDSQPLH